MAANDKVKMWVCAACGGLWFPQVAESHGGCPSCHNPTGKVKDFTAQELRDGTASQRG